MSLVAFRQLCCIVAPALRKDHPYSSVCVEVVLRWTLRWLAGGSYEDISAIASLSVPTFFRYIYAGMNAIIASDYLAIEFPASNDAIAQQCAEFTEISTHGVMRGCVGAVDGWLCRIKTPIRSETAHVTSYFSGHYHCYGVNVQASCDHLYRFTSFSIRCPGGTNYVRSFQQSALY